MLVLRFPSTDEPELPGVGKFIEYRIIIFGLLDEWPMSETSGSWS